MLYIVYAGYAVYAHIYYVHYVPYVQGGFLRSTDVYLKDHSPYLDSSLPCSKSQNIIRVNLLGNYSTSYYLVLLHY